MYYSVIHVAVNGRTEKVDLFKTKMDRCITILRIPLRSFFGSRGSACVTAVIGPPLYRRRVNMAEPGYASRVEGSAAATSPPATHFRVINALNGCEIQLPPYIHLRVRDKITLEWLLPLVSDAFDYPASHVQLIVGSTTVKFIHRISERKQTRLVDLNQPPHRYGRPLIIQAMKLPRPKFFGD